MTESSDVAQDKAAAALSSKNSIILKCKKTHTHTHKNKHHNREHIWMNTEN